MHEQYLVKKRKGFEKLQLAEIWNYRELFYFLAWRDIKARYKQTIFGVSWALIQPLVSLLVYSFFFKSLVEESEVNIPYSIFALSGIIPWIFFSNSVSAATNTMVKDANLLRKVYFPRIILPMAVVFASLIEFMISLGLIFVFMVWKGIFVGTAVVLLPVAFLNLCLTTIAFSLWFSALNVLYRDIKQIIPFILQMGLFLSPVMYSYSQLSETKYWLFILNPLVGVIELFRWCLLSDYLGCTLTLNGILIQSFITVVLFLTGVYFFRRMETIFADII